CSSDLLMVSFMFNRLITGKLFGYHLTNLFFHLTSCALVYQLFKVFKFRNDVSFILTLLFAVHPVLSQAVVWIPGRNDSMLTTFVLAGFISLIRYYETEKWFWLPVHFLALALALYTKESGVILPVMCIAYLLLFTKSSIKTYILFIAGWFVLGAVWFYMRSISIEPVIKPTLSEYATGFINRLPLFIHYIGKSLLPFNLSVFPMQADTSIVYGIAALLLLSVLLFMNKQSDKKMVLFGFSWFALFLLPAFFVPAQVNEQAFEHRLYLPIIGILLLLQQTILFADQHAAQAKMIFWSGICVCLVFVIINYNHQQKFKNEITFWENAVADSPSSSYAHKLLGVKYFNKGKFSDSEKEIREALEIDSTERYANFYFAKNLLNKNGKDPKAEYYLLKEDKLHPGFIDNVFELAKVNFEKGNKEKAESYLEECTRIAPAFMQAKNNLLLLLMEQGKKQKALDYINQWKADKSGVPEGLEKQVTAMP
ncbi:MAG: glycosyltransferase family 39 protein, partial [Cytophaga sp.]|uniref:glycosyltransferase family 39 protein n=1 Tax=Cytophaga sp. TaxID=29535 RepID=UPI003F815AD8